MKANTDRSYAAAFDAHAEVYDKGRRRVHASSLRQAFEEAGLRAGQTVMEVGAGTGQLTEALAQEGLRIVAVEPGERMRALLVDRYPEVSVRSGRFEDQPVEVGRYDAIVSANAWHWVDPKTGYSLAASNVRAGGCLLLMWSFMLLDPELQRRLNREVFTGPHADHRRDPETFSDYVDGITAAGRQEVEASGQFVATWWRYVDEDIAMTQDEYVSYLRSFANTAYLDMDEQASFAARVCATVGGSRVRALERSYQLVARRHLP